MSETRTVNVRFPLLIPTLVIIFVIAKLTGHFDYSWWWVFSPIWIPALALLGLYLVWLAVFGLLAVAYVIVALCTEGPKFFSKENRVRRKNTKNARKALNNYADALLKRRS
jgi:hypothetical protein